MMSYSNTKRTEVCIQFSGGSDSSLTAYRMSSMFEKIHLLTFKHFGQINIENSQKSFDILDKAIPGRFIHAIIPVNEIFLKIYQHNYWKNIFRYGTLQLQFTCFACQACFHVSTIKYCKNNNIYDVRDGANTEYEEASPMQIEIVKSEIKRLYEDYGILHDSPVYNEYKNNRSDQQLYELGLRPQSNIKDNEEMYKKYQGYCRFMPGSVLFLNYWKRRNDFPEKVQVLMRQHWIEEVEFLKEHIDSPSTTKK